MAASNQAFPRLDTQAIDPKTGRWSDPWYRFFITLWTRTGSGAGFDVASVTDIAEAALLSDLMGGDEDGSTDPVWPGDIDLPREGDDGLASLLLSEGDPPDPAVAGVQSVTVGTSPTNFSARASGTMLVDGGTVTGITMQRGSVTTALPLLTALFPLSAGDSASVAFSAAPTITFIPS